MWDRGVWTGPVVAAYVATMWIVAVSGSANRLTVRVHTISRGCVSRRTASYAGFQFWRDLSMVDRPGSFVAYDATTLRFIFARRFSFATYVTDAWDEAINRSVFHPALGREVEQALRAGAFAPIDCRRLAQLPDAWFYVNPQCLFKEFLSP